MIRQLNYPGVPTPTLLIVLPKYLHEISEDKLERGETTILIN